MFLQQPANQKTFLMILNVTAPLYADNGRVPCFLQHLVPLLIISTDSVPESTQEIIPSMNIALTPQK